MLNPATEKLSQYPVNIPYPFLTTSRVTTQIMEDTDGKMWICGEGLAILDPLNKSMSFEITNLDGKQGLPDKIRTLLKDKSGIYWIGTERGIAKYDPRLYSFVTVKPNAPFTLQTTNTLLEDGEHRFWAGNFVGLGSMEPSTGIYKNYNRFFGLKDEFVFSSVLDIDGTMWFGATGCLVHVYKKNKTGGIESLGADKISFPVEGKPGVTALAFDKAGILWAGTRNEGLFRYDASLKTFKQYKGIQGDRNMLSTNSILCLYAISPDSLLIGTKGNGLILMHTDVEKFQKMEFEKNGEGLQFDYSIINAISEDHKKNIWIGTESGGLWKTNRSLSAFKNYSVLDGLESMNIKQIVIDDKEQIWLSTILGLEIIDPQKKRVVHYSEKDGLSVNQPDYLIKTASGDLLRVDLNGIHIFHSSSINLNTGLPPVYINRIQVMDKTIPVYGDTVIHLTYKQNYLSFDYVALNYTQSFKNRYAYRLKGINDKWTDAGTRRSATYANMGPGSYTFQVKACNNNGIWNEKGASILFIISPPWWQSWWFYTLCIFAAAGIIYALFQYRLHQKLKAFELRNTISRDLHDEVGSTLSSISFLSAMALNDVNNNKAKTQNTLQSISDSSHKMLEAMNDIIWNIQPQNDTLENIIARMISFASELLEARKISMHCNIADNIKHLHLGVNVRHDFFVIFKEAVNNLAKYSGAVNAYINMEFDAPYLVLSIIDNGKGFDRETTGRGNGLKNMQSRAEKIGAEYQLTTAPGAGTTIILKVRPT